MENNEEKLEHQAELQRQAELVEKELEMYVDRDIIKEEEIKVEGKAFYYVKTILSGVVDQIVAVGLALVLFWVFELILKIIGYEIIGRDQIFLGIFIISNVLYYPLIQELFDGKTLGKKIMTR